MIDWKHRLCEYDGETLPKDRYDLLPGQKDQIEQLTREAEQIVAYIQKNCHQWLAQSNGRTAWRGMPRVPDGNVNAFIVRTRQNRKPRDTSNEVHSMFQQWIAAAGKAANRENAIFVTGDVDMAKDYGSAYAIFPVGDFNYTWSPKWLDWSNDAARTVPDNPTVGSIHQLLQELQSESECRAALRKVLDASPAYNDLFVYAMKRIARQARIPLVSSNMKDISSRVVRVIRSGTFRREIAGDYYNTKAHKTYYRYEDAVNQDFKKNRVVNELVSHLLQGRVQYVKGDDGTLAKALGGKSRPEIMVKCDKALSIRQSFYSSVIQRALKFGEVRPAWVKEFINSSDYDY